MTHRERHVGLHYLRIEGDTLFLRWVGDVDAAQMAELYAFAEPMFTEHPVCFMLVDATAGRRVTPEARKLALKWPHRLQTGGAAFFGASLTARTAATIMAAAMNLIFQSGSTIEFTSTEEAARAWIDARRHKMRARSG